VPKASFDDVPYTQVGGHHVEVPRLGVPVPHDRSPRHHLEGSDLGDLRDDLVVEAVDGVFVRCGVRAVIVQRQDGEPVLRRCGHPC